MPVRWCPQCQRAVTPAADHPFLVTLDSLACGCFMLIGTAALLVIVVGKLLHGRLTDGWALYIVTASFLGGALLVWARYRKHLDKRGVCPTCKLRL